MFSFGGIKVSVTCPTVGCATCTYSWCTVGVLLCFEDSALVVVVVVVPVAVPPALIASPCHPY